MMKAFMTQTQWKAQLLSEFPFEGRFPHLLQREQTPEDWEHHFRQASLRHQAARLNQKLGLSSVKCFIVGEAQTSGEDDGMWSQPACFFSATLMEHRGEWPGKEGHGGVMASTKPLAFAITCKVRELAKVLGASYKTLMDDIREDGVVDDPEMAEVSPELYHAAAADKDSLEELCLEHAWVASLLIRTWLGTEAMKGLLPGLEEHHGDSSSEAGDGEEASGQPDEEEEPQRLGQEARLGFGIHSIEDVLFMTKQTIAMILGPATRWVKHV